ncbi:transcription initiation factor TFIID component TAF4 [Mycena olivaceomarginata]|nr:transcription initiation factor TFIID component TAF4 [Mycena olivaceomarginata]
MARQAIANSQQANAGAFDTADVATLNDAIGSAGVDLRAEEESLQRSHQTPSYSGTFEDRSRKQPLRPAFDPAFLGARMRTIGANYKVGAVPDECVTYLALALRARLQDLVTEMIDAARHRTRGGRWDRAPGVYEGGGPAEGEGEGWTGPGAAWGILVRSDVAKQLAALEKVERAEEERERERRERREQATTAALTAVLNGEDPPPQIPEDDDGMDLDPPERPPRKRAVSDEAGRRMSVNAAANRAAGTGRKYAWLTVGARPQQQHQPGGFGVDAPPPPKPRPYKSGTPPPLPPDAGADPRMRITLRDAMFVVEKDRGHGGGRGAARGWT